jgi:hypothetical protein
MADNTSHLINPTDPADHLTTLPSEIPQTITSLLYATHVPDKGFHEVQRRLEEPISSSALPSDLPSLSQTSKLLHRETNARARHFLLLHKTAKAAAACF